MSKPIPNANPLVYVQSQDTKYSSPTPLASLLAPIPNALTLDPIFGKLHVAPISSGALLSAVACVGSPVLIPPGNSSDIRTVGTGGTYPTLAAAMADATVVNGTILRAVSNIVDTVQVTLNRAVVVDLKGFTHSNATTAGQIRITAPLTVIRGGVLHHTKVANTSVETVVDINLPTGKAFVVHNTIKAQEFGVTIQGGAEIFGNTFQYVGAANTNSHRFIAIYRITAETRIDKNVYECSVIPATTRYTNFVFLGNLAGSAWTAPLYVTRNTQSGGSLRQFFFNEALTPTAGAELVVAGNDFNDFNGGIGFASPDLYNGLDKIVVADNSQGADSAGNFKGMVFIDGTGAIGNTTVLEYAGNTTAAGALRADYVSMASDTTNIITHKTTVTPPTEPATEVSAAELLEQAGELLQELKGRRPHVVDSNGNPIQGFGTEEQPFVLPESGGTGPSLLFGTASPTAPGGSKPDEFFVTSDGTPTGTVTEEWIWHPASSTWIERPAAITPPEPEFAQTVYVNTDNPNTATIFDTANPPVTNDDALKANDQNIYYDTLSRPWIWNGTAYTTYTFPATVLAGFVADAPANFSIPHNVVTKITGFVTQANTAGSSWNPATGEFTAPRAGWYDVSANVRLAAGTYAGSPSVYFNLRNTTALESVWFPPAVGTYATNTMTLSGKVRLSAGQKIWISVYQFSGATKTIPQYAGSFSVLEAK